MLKRVLTAAVLIAMVASVLLWAPIVVFQFLVLALIAGALVEFYKLTLPNDTFAMITGLIFGLVFASMLIFGVYKPYILPVFSGLLFVLILVHMVHSTVAEGVIAKVGLILFGTMYLAFTLPAFVWLRLSDHGRSLIVFTLAIVALGDSFAYGFGKMIGKHKLSPLISPNKTIEGFVASFLGGIIGAVICWKVFWVELPLWLILVLGIRVAFIGALGDLIESLIKRGCHVKDSGNLLPGHGGVLDRVDALVFASPFVFFLFKFLGKI